MLSLRSLVTLSFFLVSLVCPVHSAAQVIIDGAGATFPGPLYMKWIEEYTKQNDVRITYRFVGSGKGISSLLQKTVDFGGTDVFLSNEEMRNVGAEILHIPTCVGAVAIIYNLPSQPCLKLTPVCLAEIFLGKVTHWSNRSLQTINGDAELPDLEITLIHRSDSSGTNYLLTNYLSQVNTEWKHTMGQGKVVRWKRGIGAETNAGIAETVKRIPGSVGYVSLNYALEEKLPVAKIQNSRGKFVAPDGTSLSAAASVDIPDDMRKILTNTETLDGYPISAFSYLIFCREQFYNERNDARARALAQFLWWCIHEGQRYNESLNYAPLPETLAAKIEGVIRSMTYKGERLIK